ncbi:GtrA family protein [Tropicimonas sediminicola]|uniref:Putative flippase GtrA (Transmembrane translocase of bactoprenol-linked glucose) n=1 Tax=Tropicimonas sediminicola TaxID=1031541 RepID=A0A239LDH4_9RHOB|nr:GtrA family protein [Tropicimonas sediminicola]SNT27689.1 Putative flippase GtrA (transmembrane translocase of bactoprenol-linked glucose) [Tropicimonas sediminicola]
MSTPRTLMKLPPEFLQFLKFSTVGTSNSLIHYVVFLFMFRIFAINYLIACCMGYAAGLTNSFFWNRRWTFRYAGESDRATLARFVIINLTALCSTLAFLFLLVNGFEIREEFAQFFTIGVSMMINFLGNKYWTFR